MANEKFKVDFPMCGRNGNSRCNLGLHRMNRYFGLHIKEAKDTLFPQKYKVEFPMCEHPELIPTGWNQPKPEPIQTIGKCPIHDWVCPVCGLGAGCDPACDCSEMRY